MAAAGRAFSASEIEIVALRVIHRQGRLCYYSKFASGRLQKGRVSFSRSPQARVAPPQL